MPKRRLRLPLQDKVDWRLGEATAEPKIRVKCWVTLPFGKAFNERRISRFSSDYTFVQLNREFLLAILNL
jgi:hypothetical protein